MPVRTWFPTEIYCEPLQAAGLAKFNAELIDECRNLRDYDAAGRKWSAKNYPGGYTSYASMNELHRFSSTFAGLEKKLLRHARDYARTLEFDLRGCTIRMTDCWVNIMPPTAAHSLHLHPLAFISGTYYVATPPGCSGLKFEDPRLERFMAAPPTANPATARTSHTPPRPATSSSSKAGYGTKSPPTASTTNASASALISTGAEAGPTVAIFFDPALAKCAHRAFVPHDCHPSHG
jgi:uncharacterized protein (TIGR02466 family)